MAGVLLHLAMGDPARLDPGNQVYGMSAKKAYILGLLLPDIAKQGFIGSEDDFGRFFEGCLETDIMSYEEYLQFSRNHHFNPDPQDPARQDTRRPRLPDFFSAGYADLGKPVWNGVLCHLMGDKAFYYKSYCVDDERAMEDYRREVGEMKVWDRAKWISSKTGRVYYDDYNVLNKRIEDEFGVLARAGHILSAPLLREILAGFKVEFSAGRTEPVYMNLENIRKYIVFSRGLCRGTAEGKEEELLRLFDEKRLDLFFTGAACR